MTQRYVAENSGKTSTGAKIVPDQVQLVYKFLGTPVEMLVSGMSKMQPNQLIQFYKKLARQLHPDKNCHPEAKDAF